MENEYEYDKKIMSRGSLCQYTQEISILKFILAKKDFGDKFEFWL